MSYLDPTRYTVDARSTGRWRKIEDGSYGYCGISGDPIGLQRLLLRPTAELSFEEKARQEELERSYTKRRG
ncbi:TraR/DksA family transcriptional regulator [Microbulbifer sp.]|uniref:TraR/DksA family transcriptional regulator n=1 Tax=Microbulbifer sp. TaxID=1908541 RepID=UPI003F356A8B